MLQAGIPTSDVSTCFQSSREILQVYILLTQISMYWKGQSLQQQVRKQVLLLHPA